MKLIRRLMALLLLFVLIAAVVIGIYTMYPLNYVTAIRETSEEFGVEKYLVAALIRAESNYDKDAVSSAGAKGVMQLTDETASFCAKKLGMEIDEDDIYNPEINIKLGVFYLKRMLEMFEGDETKAIAAYNAGEGRVHRWLENPEYSSDGVELEVIPYEETKRHVEKIERYKKIYKILYPNL